MSGDQPTSRVALVMLAAGEGRRARPDDPAQAAHHANKVLLPLAGRRVFTWSVRWARLLPAVAHTLVVIREEDRADVAWAIEREVGAPAPEVVVGGDTRHASEHNALQALAPDIDDGRVDVVVIHDAARPLASTDLFAAVVAAAAEHGGAIPVRTQTGIASMNGDAEPPSDLVAVQTPQAFRAAPLLAAYARAAADGFVGTDTASCIERYTDLPVACVPGDARNVKITFPDDLFLAEQLLAKSGFDLSGGREQPRRRTLGNLLGRGERR